VRLVEPDPLSERVCRDPDDDVVLATALAGGCRCIVTGDRDLLVLGEYQGIVIVSPRDFWNFESSQALSPDANA
jgi:predicted nucleic acid-binding protein